VEDRVAVVDELVDVIDVEGEFPDVVLVRVTEIDGGELRALVGQVVGAEGAPEGREGERARRDLELAQCRHVLGDGGGLREEAGVGAPREEHPDVGGCGGRRQIGREFPVGMPPLIVECLHLIPP